MRNRIAIVAVLMLASWVSAACASGDKFTLTGHDLEVTVNSQWVGCGAGGYCPVRVKVTNRGPTRTFTFRMTKMYEDIATTKQTLEIPQNGTVKFSLPVPMVNLSTQAEFRIEQYGRLLENMHRHVAFPGANLTTLARPSYLVVTPDAKGLKEFEDGSATYRQIAGLLHSGSHHGYGGSVTENGLVLPASDLPASWIEYSGIDMVFIPLDSMTKLPKSVRVALIEWARCGGTLAITEAGDVGPSREAAQRVIVGDSGSAGQSMRWAGAVAANREIPLVVSIESGGAVRSSSPAPTGLTGSWSLETPFSVTDYGFGRVAVFTTDPFPGTAQDWCWFFKSLGSVNQWEFGKRIGQNARFGTDDFMMFLIPGIGGVPVIMFLVLITIFAVVIGPVNYFVLAKRKQLHLLLLTIPGLALVTSLLLFGYSVVAHGFGVKARARSVTLIDQAAQSAVTHARLSLHAGQAPSAGMRFSRDTAVLPVWPENESFTAGVTDWTDSQDLTSGWLRSRTRTQFITLRHRAERGRLEVKPQASDKLVVANGFEWGFSYLMVADDQGRLFAGKDIPAGASADLKPITEDELAAFYETMRANPLEVPAGLRGANANMWFWTNPRHRYGYHPYYGLGSNKLYHAHESQLEAVWRGLSTSGNGAPALISGGANFSGNRAYFGLADRNPNVELGVAKAKEMASSHVIVGHW